MSLPSVYRHPYLGILGVHYADDPTALTVRFGNKDVPYVFLRDGTFTDDRRRPTKCCLISLAGAGVSEDDIPDLEVDNGSSARPVRPKPAEPTDDILRSFPELGPEITPPQDPATEVTQPHA